MRNGGRWKWKLQSNSAVVAARILGFTNVLGETAWGEFLIAAKALMSSCSHGA